MKNINLFLTDDEKKFIRNRYPNVDVDNLNLPALGMASVISFDLLRASIKSDLEYKCFEDSINPSDTLNNCLSIQEKIERYSNV